MKRLTAGINSNSMTPAIQIDDYRNYLSDCVRCNMPKCSFDVLGLVAQFQIPSRYYLPGNTLGKSYINKNYFI